ncbi:WW domain-containing oxidoreductase [Drosophila grimshawi]|uniref:WW domain-containing oxidoreductase n=1 Tax=Drosophila grimshawi TaxID=7222 RepID=B4JAP5_DROGR|nr:WW domain-containing oxidoreductase [Drosophila grimshawi]EDW03853.1 GH11466 [Drosophila grimshawi]
MMSLPDSDSEDELPPGWEERATDDGAVCYVNQQTKVSQWTHPRTGRSKRITGELPLGWEKYYDEQSKRQMFLNKETQQRTNIDPRLAFAVEEPTLNVAQVRQRFDSNSRALQVLHGKDLHGRLALITGANCGIGFETARSLALHGCEIIFACRNLSAAQEAIERIAVERPAARARCRSVSLDLASLRAVQQFVAQIKQSVSYIDYLILNAGVFGLPYTKTVDGLETTFQVSHLSHFYLTLQLESLFDHRTRIVVVSSESHRTANLPADHLTVQHLSPPAEKYWSMIAYSNAKLCNILFAQELAQRWKQRGISVFSLHPGNMVATELSRNYWFYRLIFAIVRPFTKSLQQAAATTIYCATANELTGLSGLYFNNCYFCEPSKLAKSEPLQQQLWTHSERLISDLITTNN